MAMIQGEKGDYFGSQESVSNSMLFLDERKAEHRYCLQSNYVQLGNMKLNLKNYREAIEDYRKAIEYKTNNIYRLIALNNEALAYQKLGEYSISDSLYDNIEDSYVGAPEEYARKLSNHARTRWLAHSSYNASHELLRALAIRDSLGDGTGINASYAHLADYYTIIRPDSALLFTHKRLALLKSLDSPDDELEALDKLIKLSPDKDMRPYFNRYKSLSDSLQTARNRAKNQFALIRYETEKSKSENLELQKDNAQKDAQLLLAGALILLTTIIGYAYYRKRIRDNQLKTSQKVHDVVANGLYRTMTAIEHNAIDKDQLLDDLEKLYDQSRDISYDAPITQRTPFQQVISSLAASYRSETTGIYITGNNQPLWDQSSKRNQTQIQLVIQELLVNMKKHSGAQNVVLKFEQQGNSINIYYKDDGVGLPADLKFGNGLTNTGNRIKSIGGEFIFESATKGLNIRISIPTDRKS